MFVGVVALRYQPHTTHVLCDVDNGVPHQRLYVCSCSVCTNLYIVFNQCFFSVEHKTFNIICCQNRGIPCVLCYLILALLFLAQAPSPLKQYYNGYKSISTHHPVLYWFIERVAKIVIPGTPISHCSPFVQLYYLLV